MNPIMNSSQNSQPSEPLSLEQILGMNGDQQLNSKIPNSHKVNNSQSNSLSLQDKQRIIQQSEAQKRLQSEPILSPTQAAQKLPPPVKDLTASLIENNLSQMSLTQPLHSNPISSGFPLNKTTSTNFSQSNLSAFTQNMPGSQPLPVQPMLTSSQMARPPVPQLSAQFPMRPNLPQSSFNFMSVNPPVQLQLSPSMNSMQLAPFGNSPGSLNSQPTKQLSSSEIDDFLS